MKNGNFCCLVTNQFSCFYVDLSISAFLGGFLFCFVFCAPCLAYMQYKIWPDGLLSFPGAADGKESVCNVGDLGSIPRLESSPGEWQPIPVFLPREFHGCRSLASYSPWDHKESDMTERLTLSLFPIFPSKYYQTFL